MKMKLTTWILLVLCLAISAGAAAQVPNAADINVMAVYKASVGVTDSIPDNLVNYNITSPATIAAMIGGIENDTLRDCVGYDAKNNAYLYVKFINGTRKVYHLYLNWMHFSKMDDRDHCYYITPASQALFKSNAQ